MSSRSAADRAVLVGGCLGAWGIATGYGLFLVLWHEQHHALRFLLALLIAAFASFVIESARARIEGHGGHGLNGPRLAVTILILAVAELFVVAAEKAANPPAGAVSAIGEALLGPLPANVVPRGLTVGALAFVWLLLGFVLGAGLTAAVAEEKGGLRAQAGRGARGGALAGAVFAPLAMLALVLVARGAASIWLLVVDYPQWKALVDRLSGFGGWFFVLTAPVRLCDWLWTSFAWGKWAVILGGGGVLLSGLQQRDSPVVKWLLLLAALLVGIPLLSDLEALLKLMLLAAVAWGVPGVSLGLFAPLLRRPAEHSPAWGVVALVGAGILVLLTATRLVSAFFLVPAAALLLAALLFRRGASAADWWPLPALLCALTVTGASHLSQKATFGGILEALHDVAAPEPPPPPRPLPLDSLPFRRPTADFSSLLKQWQPLLSHLPREEYAAKRRALPALAGNDADREALGRYLRIEALPLEQRLREAEALLAPGNLPSLSVLNLSLRSLLGSEIAELRGAAKLSGSGGGMTVLAERHDIAVNGLREWSTEQALAAARGALERVTREVVEAQEAALRALDESPPVALADVSARLAEVRGTPWRTDAIVAAAERAALRLARQEQALRGEAYEELAAAWQALAHLHLEEKLGAAEDLLRRIEAAKPGFRDEEAARRLEELRSAAEAEAGRTRAELRGSAARLLELALAGSLGFWVSVAMLAGFAMRRAGGH